MSAENSPDLETNVSGLVIMSAAPNKNWGLGIEERAKKYKIKDTGYFRDIYNKNKNNENFKQFTLVGWQYFRKY